MSPPVDPQKTANEAANKVVDKVQSAADKASAVLSGAEKVNNATPNAVKSGAASAAKGGVEKAASEAISEAVKNAPQAAKDAILKNAPQAAKDAINNAPNPKQVLQDKLGTNPGMVGNLMHSFNTNRLAWGAVAALGLGVYWLTSDSNKPHKPRLAEPNATGERLTDGTGRPAQG